MKRIGIILISLATIAIHPMSIQAQEVENREVTNTRHVVSQEEADENLRMSRIRSTIEPTASETDTLANMYDSPIINMPWMGYGLGTWDLHDGLNAQIGAGVRVGWGKNNPWKGASFFTDIAAMYCMPLSKNGRWSAAVGGYFSNYRMWGRQMNSVGLCGLVNYKINEQMDFSGFIIHDFGVIGDKAAGAPYMPFLDQPSTTVGGQLGINIGEKARLNIGLSFTRQNNPFPYNIDSAGRPLPMHPTRSITDPDF